MAVSVFEMYENAKLAREMAVMGNYESSGVYYEGTLQQINRLIMASDNSSKQKWLSVSMAYFIILISMYFKHFKFIFLFAFILRIDFYFEKKKK